MSVINCVPSNIPYVIPEPIDDLTQTSEVPYVVPAEFTGPPVTVLKMKWVKTALISTGLAVIFLILLSVIFPPAAATYVPEIEVVTIGATTEIIETGQYLTYVDPVFNRDTIYLPTVYLP